MVLPENNEGASSMLLFGQRRIMFYLKEMTRRLGSIHGEKRWKVASHRVLY
jgi:hypothetical protein